MTGRSASEVPHYFIGDLPGEIIPPLEQEEVRSGKRKSTQEYEKARKALLITTGCVVPSPPPYFGFGAPRPLPGTMPLTFCFSEGPLVGYSQRPAHYCDENNSSHQMATSSRNHPPHQPEILCEDCCAEQAEFPIYSVVLAFWRNKESPCEKCVLARTNTLEASRPAPPNINVSSPGLSAGESGPSLEPLVENSRDYEAELSELKRVNPDEEFSERP